MATATPTRPSTSLWSTVRDSLRDRAERKARHRTLVRELAHYRTPLERAELDAMLDRGEPHQVAELRKIIERQRMAA